MKPQKKGRGVAGAFMQSMKTRQMRHDLRTGKDTPVTDWQEVNDNLNASYDEDDARREREGDHEFRGRGAMVAQPDASAVRRPARGDNVLSTMDKHGVTDIVRNLSEHPTRAEAQAEFQRLGGSSWNPADPFSADNPAVAKQLREQGLARKRKIR